MRLTAGQIQKMAEATFQNPDVELFYLEEASDGKLKFGSVEIVESRKVIALGKIKVDDDNGEESE